jgi:hypothetical protein
METTRIRLKWAAAALLALGAVSLAACDSRVSSSATANVPVQYSHVWVTVTQVWVHASATAAPEDAGWLKFPLDDPQTLDLVGLTNGVATEFANGLPVPTGTYNQMRLILSDTSASLEDAAQTAGAQFNNEVDYFDTSGVAQQAPLAVLNAAQGVGIPVTLKVVKPTSAIFAAIGSASTTSNLPGTSTTDTSTTTTSTSTTSTTSTTSGSATDTSGLGTITARASVIFDAARDIAPFTYSDVPGFVLNAMVGAQDLAKVATIASQLDINAIPIDGNTARPDVQVTATRPNADGTRNVPVLSAPVRSDGTFVLSPFPNGSGDPDSYDLVIHGPQVQTVIIKSVPVSTGSAATAATVSLSNLTLAAANFYFVNVAAGSPVSPRGARVGFYQTLQGSGEIPYLIEERAIDPLTGLFDDDRALSAANVASGTYSSSQSLQITIAAPTEGSGAYQVSASAALYGDAAFVATLAPPASGSTNTLTFNGPTIDVPTTATAASIATTVNITTPGRYDKGVLVVTHDGGVVATSALDSLLAQASGTVNIGAIPGGSETAAFERGVYYAEAWVWNSSDPTGTFSRQPAAALVDLRATNAGALTQTIN